MRNSTSGATALSPSVFFSHRVYSDQARFPDTDSVRSDICLWYVGVGDRSSMTLMPPFALVRMYNRCVFSYLEKTFHVKQQVVGDLTQTSNRST